MGNVQTRLTAEKQRVLRQALAEMAVNLTDEQVRRISLLLMPGLEDRGYEVRMRGGDRMWWKGEEPPGAEEIRGWSADELETWPASAIDRQNEQAELIRELERKLDAYRDEVREMRLAILVLLETWDELVGEMQPEHQYLPKNARRALEILVEALRERWGYDVVREDQDGAPFPDQPRDGQHRRMWPFAEARRLPGG